MQRRTTPHLTPLDQTLPARRRTLLPIALTALLTTGALAAPAAATTAPAPAAATAVSLFPSDALTVRDQRQLTGRRVALPTAGCTGTTTCGLVERVNQLDGFDLDPRLALRFDGPVDVADVVASTRVVPTDGSAPIRIDRVVYDPATSTVYAHPVWQLAPSTTYRLVVSGDHGLPRAETSFTTLSATDGLLDLRRQLDSGQAFRDADIRLDKRGLRVEATVPTAGTTFGYVQDRGSAGGLVPTEVPALATGTVVFGSYLAPDWLREDGTIATAPTGQDGPAAVGRERLPFVLVLPAGAAPAGGWPTAVFGHGFTRSTTDVLLAAATNSAQGIATIATDVVGHGYGPRSTWTVTRAGETRTLPAYARGLDIDGNGTITSSEGSSTLPTGPAAALGSSDALRQTAADVMTLLRAVSRGVDVAGSPASDLRTTDIGYFGQSFGGIYGTMLTGADPSVSRAVLNVGGGPVNEIVRLAPVFRPLLTQSLQIAGLLNSDDPAKAYFEESLPLRGQGPVLDPAPGALAIQDYLALSTWLSRPGSPETFAPLVRDDRALFQVAYGDQTVPNPTSWTLLAAGGLFDRAALYRNDRTAARSSNPHGFLLDAATFPVAFGQGQAQVREFLATGRTIDPDGPGDVWIVPAPAKVLRTLNFVAPTAP